MKALPFSLLLLSISSAATAAPTTVNVQKHFPTEICDAFGIQPCTIKSVDAFSEVDLNNDGVKEIIFAHGGGSCGEQHYIYAYRNKKWEQIANWCGMDGGAYKVLPSKHNEYFDIDTYLGVIRFDGKKYPDTTSK